MTIEDFLIRNREKICRDWEEKTLSSYSKHASNLYGRDKNRFSNPVGNQLRSAISLCFQYLIEAETSPETLTPVLSDFIRIRAVQDFRPSDAVGFILQLKDVVWELLNNHPELDRLVTEWVRIQSKIDCLTCLAFDIYVESRQRVFEVRIKELKRTGYRYLREIDLDDSDRTVDPRAIGGGQ
jgi:hypothetical protein